MTSKRSNDVTVQSVNNITSSMPHSSQSLTHMIPASSQPDKVETCNEQVSLKSNPTCKHSTPNCIPVKCDNIKNSVEKEKASSYSNDKTRIVENGCIETVRDNVFSMESDDTKLYAQPSAAVSVPPSDTGRKGSFMITRVVAKDLPEDLDDTANTEDANSVVMDLSRLTDQMITEVPSSTDTLHTPDEEVPPWPSSPRVGVITNPMLSPSNLHDDAHSRFRIVKIESRDRWHRGRWTCHDFADPPVERETTHLSGSGDNGASSVAASVGAPIYYIPGIHDNCKSPFGIVYCNTGVPVLEPNPLTSPLYTRGLQFFVESADASVTIQETGLLVNSSVSSVVARTIDVHNQSITPGDVSSSPAVRQLFSNDTGRSLSRPLSASSSDIVVDKLQPQVQISDSASACQATGNLPSVGSATNLVSVGGVLSRTNSQIIPLDAMMSATLNLAVGGESK